MIPNKKENLDRNGDYIRYIIDKFGKTELDELYRIMFCIESYTKYYFEYNTLDEFFYKDINFIKPLKTSTRFDIIFNNIETEDKRDDSLIELYKKHFLILKENNKLYIDIIKNGNENYKYNYLENNVCSLINEELLKKEYDYIFTKENIKKKYKNLKLGDWIYMNEKNIFENSN